MSTRSVVERDPSDCSLSIGLQAAHTEKLQGERRKDENTWYLNAPLHLRELAVCGQAVLEQSAHALLRGRDAQQPRADVADSRSAQHAHDLCRGAPCMCALGRDVFVCGTGVLRRLPLSLMGRQYVIRSETCDSRSTYLHDSL